MEKVQHAPFLVQDGLRYQALEEVVEAHSRLCISVAGYYLSLDFSTEHT
jgi:hypothetical protein